MIVYVVSPGDSIYSIAQRYGMTSEQVISDNRLADPDNLVVGQTLVLMTNSIPHTVARGQSLYSIARGYGVALDDLIAANPQIENPARLTPGQIVNVPVKSEKLGSIIVNGFAFPSISMEVLGETLPYLTYLSIFSYQVRPGGGLSSLNDEPLIQAAWLGGVAPLMVITNIEEGAGFSSELAGEILTNEQAQETLIANILATLNAKDYYGLVVDFEYIFPEQKENYNRFLQKLSQRLKPLGYLLMTAVAPKTSADQPGLLYQAHDYPAHGEYMDRVIIMTYEWGYTYPPGGYMRLAHAFLKKQ